MRFRAGLRRMDVPPPTEYNLQFTWKDPVPDHTPYSAPIIQAEETLMSGKNQSLSHNQPKVAHQKRQKGESERTSVHNGDRNNVRVSPKQAKEGVRQNGITHGNDDVIDGSHDSPVGRHKVKVPKLDLEESMKSSSDHVNHVHQHGSYGSSSKASKPKPKSHRHHHHHHHQQHKHHGEHGVSKKHKSGHSRVFMSEYKREFKVWPVASTTSGEKKGGKKGKLEAKGVCVCV